MREPGGVELHKFDVLQLQTGGQGQRPCRRRSDPAEFDVVWNSRPAPPVANKHVARVDGLNLARMRVKGHDAGRLFAVVGEHL